MLSTCDKSFSTCWRPQSLIIVEFKVISRPETTVTLHHIPPSASLLYAHHSCTSSAHQARAVTHVDNLLFLRYIERRRASRFVMFLLIGSNRWSRGKIVSSVAGYCTDSARIVSYLEWACGHLNGSSVVIIFSVWFPRRSVRGCCCCCVATIWHPTTGVVTDVLLRLDIPYCFY